MGEKIQEPRWMMVEIQGKVSERTWYGDAERNSEMNRH